MPFYARPAVIMWGAVAARLCFFAMACVVARGWPLVREPDSVGYAAAATNLARGEGFTIDGTPEIERTPGYPLLLVPGEWFGSIDGWAIALQAALSAVTVLAVYRTAEALWPESKARAYAGLLAACEPVSILYSCKLLTETTFAALVAVAVWQLVEYVIRPTLFRIVPAAVLVACAAFVRPIAYFLAPVLAVMLLLVLRRRMLDRPRLAAQVLLFLLVAQTPLVAWQVRNTRVAGYRGFSAIADINLYYWNGAAILARQEGIDWREMQARMGFPDRKEYLRLHPEQKDWSEAKRHAFYRAEGLRIEIGDFWGAIAVQLEGIRHMLTDAGTGAFLSYLEKPNDGDVTARAAGTTEPLAKQLRAHETLIGRAARVVRDKPGTLAAHIALCLALAAYHTAAAVGLFAKPVRTNPATTILVAVLLYLVILSGGPSANHRFRVPLTPMLSVFGGCGIALVAGMCTHLARRE